MKFFSDLDRTLIYSPRFKGSDEDCQLVEHKGEKEIAFMTKQAYTLLKEVRQKTDFIPVTTRDYESLIQISFIHDNLPQIMVCDNGASIFVNGKRDFLWDFYMKDSQKSIHPFSEVLGLVQTNIKESLVVPERDLYLRLKHVTPEDTQSLNRLNNRLILMGYRLYIQGKKAYVFPWFVKKESAVSYLLADKDYPKSISAGDSEMDKGMLARTRIALAPKHHTISNAVVTVTKHQGIQAGEEILQKVLSVVG